MGYVFKNPENGQTFKMPDAEWFELVNLSKQFGWTPKGTQVPKDVDMDSDEWDGTYFGHYGQKVVQEDALALSAVMKTSVDEMGDHLSATPPERFRSFIEFCSQGAFIIGPEREPSRV